jgi:4-amino-4-deoxy-L-arabinose transferase-like glycosyltransferase
MQQAIVTAAGLSMLFGLALREIAVPSAGEAETFAVPPALERGSPEETGRQRPRFSLGRVLIPVLLLAAAVRVIGFFEVKDTPILHLHRWSEADSSFYLAWSRDIRNGDWLTARDTRPYHSWHDWIARTVHRRSGSRQPFDEAVGRRMWNRWLGDKTFYEDPLYPYFLAALFSVVGEDVRAVWLVQSLVGLATVGLVVVLGAILFDSTIALVAGIMAALFGPLVFYEALLLRSVFNAFSGLVTVTLVTLAFRDERPRLWFVTGLAFGLSVLVQSTALVFAAFVGAMMLARHWRKPRSLRTSFGAYAVGLLLGVCPLPARNLAVGAAVLQPAANGVITFINQNAADSEPASGFQLSLHAADIMDRTDGRLVPSVVATVETHSGLGGWLALCARKVLAFWRWYEIPNDANYYYWCLYARMVCGLALTFATVGPLGAAGLVIALRERRTCVPAAAFIASGMLVSFLFLTLSRLRLPYALALIPFAAFTLVSMARWLRGRLFRRTGAAGAAVVLAAAVSWQPLPPDRSAIWAADYGTGNEIVWQLARRKAAANDLSGAIRLIEDQLETEPEALRRLEPAATPAVIPLIASDVAGSFAPLHELAAELYAARRDMPRADHHRWRATVLKMVSARREEAKRRAKDSTR